MRNEGKSFRISIYTFIGLFLFVSVIFPIVSVLINVEWSNFDDLISSELFKTSFHNSVIVSSVGTIISVVIAYALAFAINRTHIKGKRVLTILFTLPMLIPSISHGIGIINLFGKNGIITNLVGIDFDIMGVNGIVLGSILYSFPVAFLLFVDAFKYVDNSMYECAEVLGMNKMQQFKEITFYYMKKPILSACFAIFTMIFTDYGVPIAIGGRYDTLPVFLYREVIGLLDFSKGAMIGMFLLIPAFISFIFDIMNKDVQGNNNYNKEFHIKEDKVRDIIFTIITGIVVVVLLCLFGSFLYLAFINNFPYDKSLSLVHFEYVIRNGIMGYIFNSVFISIMVAIVGTVFAYFTAYITARFEEKFNKIFHILAICSLAIPGIFLGLAYIFAFKNTFIYNTFIILIMVNIVHFFASPYLLAYNALGKLNKNYEIVGLTCGVNRVRIIKDVIIPNSKETILEMVSYFFVNSMITISAVSFLFNTDNMPISLLINQYKGQLMYEEAAIISLTILAINLVFKAVVGVLRKKFGGRKIGEIK